MTAIKSDEELLSELAKEMKELEEKLNPLEKFVISPLFDDIEKHHRQLLWEQYKTMLKYHMVLQLRYYAVLGGGR